MIELDEEDPFLVRTILNYMYQLDYSDSSDELLTKGISPIRFNVLVYAMAEKFQIPPLKKLAAQKFEKLIGTQWDRDTFPAIIRAVYESTPRGDRGLRDVVVKTVAAHTAQLLSVPTPPVEQTPETRKKTPQSSPQLQSVSAFPPAKNAFVSIIEQVPSFGVDLVLVMSRSISSNNTSTSSTTTQDGAKFKCPKCKKHWCGEVPTITSSHCPHCDYNPDGWTSHIVA